MLSVQKILSAAAGGPLDGGRPICTAQSAQPVWPPLNRPIIVGRYAALMRKKRADKIRSGRNAACVNRSCLRQWRTIVFVRRLLEIFF